MSKYYDKLVEINESLTRELKEKGLYKEDGQGDMVPVPADSLTDDQKKKILSDTIHEKLGKDVDDKTIDEIAKDPAATATVQKLLGGGNGQGGNQAAPANESDEDDESEELVYVRMDDDDLDMHGYIGDGSEDFNLVDDEKDAAVFTRAQAANKISEVCDKYHYDYNTFNIQDVDSQVADNGENWVSIDSSNPSATVVP